jgi:hypothetical protein
VSTGSGREIWRFANYTNLETIGEIWRFTNYTNLYTGYLEDILSYVGPPFFLRVIQFCFQIRRSNERCGSSFQLTQSINSPQFLKLGVAKLTYTTSEFLKALVLSLPDMDLRSVKCIGSSESKTAPCRRSDCQLFCGKRVPRGQRGGSLRPYSWFSRQEPLLLYQVAPQLYSRGWVDPVPDPLLLFSGSAGNRTRSSGSVAKNSDH